VVYFILYLTVNSLYTTGTRERHLYAYPPSRTPSPTPTHPPSLGLRLKLLQSEIASLETELADPTNPLLARDREQSQVDPGQLLKGLVDIKARLAKFSASHEGRVRLVQGVLQDHPPQAVHTTETVPEKNGSGVNREAKEPHKSSETAAKDFADIDRRIGELERLIGSASTSLDEVCLSFIRSMGKVLRSDIDVELSDANAASTASH
jgi:nuclear migration protein JNM1